MTSIVQVLNLIAFLIAINHCNCFNVVERPHFIESHGNKSTSKGPRAVEKSALYWNTLAQIKLRDQILSRRNHNIAKNVIIFMGDGMSLPTITASRIYLGQKFGYSGEESKLSFENFPFVGLAKTYCVDQQTADSACAGTAYLSGVKANFGTIGVTAAVELNNCSASTDKRNHVSSILDWAQRAGKATGIVTTTRVTHASPASAYAHAAHRNWECDTDIIRLKQDPNSCLDIAQQLVRESPGNKLKVVFGGGRNKFLPKEAKDHEGLNGQRSDGQNLIGEWLQSKRNSNAKFIYDKKGLHHLNVSSTDYVLGLFTSDHMPFHLDSNDKVIPTLAEMTKTAIQILEKDHNGYVLFVEGGRIDDAHHANLAMKALDDTVEFSEAIQVASEITNDANTLMIVTADHAHTMSISGYSDRGNDILGFNTETQNFTTLSYANGPSADHQNIVNDFDHKGEYPALFSVDSETHGGDDVTIYANGPYSHLFTGVLEQNVIPHFAAYAACIGDGLTACTKHKPMPDLFKLFN